MRHAVEDAADEVEHGARLVRRRGEDRQHATLTGRQHPAMVYKGSDVGGQNRDGARLPATATDHTPKLVYGLARLHLAAGEGSKDLPLDGRQRLAHDRDQQGAPRCPRRGAYQRSENVGRVECGPHGLELLHETPP